MKKLSVDIEDKMFNEIQDLCETLKKSMDEFVIDALEKYVEKKMELLDSEKVDEVLEELQGEGEDEWM